MPENLPLHLQAQSRLVDGTAFLPGDGTINLQK